MSVQVGSKSTLHFEGGLVVGSDGKRVNLMPWGPHIPYDPNRVGRLRVWWLMLRAWVRGLFHRPARRQLASGGVYREAMRGARWSGTTVSYVRHGPRRDSELGLLAGSSRAHQGAERWPKAPNVISGIPYCACGHETAVHRRGEKDGPVCRGTITISGKHGKWPCPCDNESGREKPRSEP